MPTPSGKETTYEREARQRAERYAAMRAAITDAQRARATLDADAWNNVETQYPAGERVTLRAGRRSITVDTGELDMLALADELRARGYALIAERVTFGLYAGRDTVRYQPVTAR